MTESRRQQASPERRLDKKWDWNHSPFKTTYWGRMPKAQSVAALPAAGKKVTPKEFERVVKRLYDEQNRYKERREA